MYDVIIVGAGCVGCATARELSKYQLKVLVLEKGHDLCSGASKANTGMIHAGYDPTPDTNKAKFNAPGSRMMFEACTELDVPFGKTGLMIFATEESGMAEIDKLVGYAEKNQVHVEVVKPPKLYEMQPNMGKDVKEVLWVPDGGYTNPFSVTFAFAENAHKNGVEFKVDSQVTAILPIDGDGKNGYTVTAREGATEDQKEEVTYQARMVVNAAGLHSDTINNMVSEHKFKIIPRFGAHVILDRKQSYKLTTSLMETPHDLPGGGHTKGQAIIPSTGGTMLLGCDAKEVMDPDTTEWERPSAMQIINYFKNIWHTLPLGADGSEFPMDEIIAVFGGCRPHPDGDDFVIGEPDDAPNFVNAGGTESPAFTASPAIAEYVAGVCIDRLQPAKNENFDPYRKRKGVFREMTDEEKAQAIAEDPDYAKIVCRCEMVTEAEIRDAIRRPLGARDLAGVKLRTRAGMGRCQGGFCSSRVLEILAEELGIDPLEVTQCGGASRILASRCGMMEEEVQS